MKSIKIKAQVSLNAFLTGEVEVPDEYDIQDIYSAIWKNKDNLTQSGLEMNDVEYISEVSDVDE